ncbi:MAG: tRNA (N(6)-L-threonylcarbamoyladenosine(37)-C(2))-methylthiotransferase MtaB [Candidatus Krumholzibacteria bacterium]|nr:tRNA (N(6)-L-threonylcarbamoyladenosine(37)-C(2))-methylthiotransferase MtaB [Candidatus Krumholzibacteria bacterium]
MEKTFSILTLGCKLNQYESECIREALQRRSWRCRRFDEGASFYIINSCTVTGRSDARCRNVVRRTRRAAPHAFIVVTGCYAETEPESVEAMGEADLVLGNDAKRSIGAILDEVAATNGAVGRIDPQRLMGIHAADEEGIQRFFDHSRAFVKVQEGCNAACSYCIVPRARGRSRSVPAGVVLSQVLALGGNGYREIVLTGVHIGRYGEDLDPPMTLASLVSAIIEGTNEIRIRLSSIEPTEVSASLLDIAAQTDRLAPHFHIPLQSGDDRVLSAMNRPYRSADFRSRIDRIARAREGIAIGTDIIVGFPGESDECFENTFALLEELPISYFHVFGFSPRPQTPAAAMMDRVSPAVKKTRSSRLIALGEAKNRVFLEAQLGTEQLALVEGQVRHASSLVRSLTGNYCEVLIPRGQARAGSLVPVRVDRFEDGKIYGMALEPDAARARETGACGS